MMKYFRLLSLVCLAFLCSCLLDRSFDGFTTGGAAGMGGDAGAGGIGGIAGMGGDPGGSGGGGSASGGAGMGGDAGQAGTGGIPIGGFGGLGGIGGSPGGSGGSPGGSGGAGGMGGQGGSGGSPILCGAQPVPQNGYAVCWELSSLSLNPGKYGTITASLNLPALSGPSDPITPGCVSQQPGTANDSTNPSVLCPLTGAIAGTTVYLALKSYDTNVGNPPLPFFAFRCDYQDLPTGKCLGVMKLYLNGVLQETFTHPPVVPFSYYDLDLPEPIQLKVLLP
jgi:hypothetical protein